MSSWSSLRYSTGDVVDTMSMSDAINLFESLWTTPFWTPKTVLYDPAFNNTEFTDFLSAHDIEHRPIPTRRHNKNVIESKHRIIRDIYLRLKHECNEENAIKERLIVQQALRISNDLYGSDVCSAQELAKGYTRPATVGSYPVIVPEDILQAHDNLLAKRKLTRILRSKTTSDIPVKVDDIIQIFIREQKDKRGKWSVPKVILDFDRNSGTVAVPGKNGKTIKAAIEDVRPALPENTLASAVQDGIDTLSRSLDDVIDQLGSEAPYDTTEGSDFNIAGQPKSIDYVENFLEDTEENLTPLPTVGDSIDVYWPLDDAFYTGKVSSINDDENEYNTDYNDGDKETQNLSDEVWKYSPQDTM